MYFLLVRHNASCICAWHQYGALSDNLKGLPHGLKLCSLVAFQFGPDFLEASRSLQGIKALATVQADVGPNVDDGRMDTTAQQLLDLLLNELSAANGAFLKRSHYFLLSRQLSHRSGSGRYTVTSTVQRLSLLYAQTLCTATPLGVWREIKQLG
jgi:hypothetical protein